MTRLVIVRHGNTFEAGETPRRIGARTDLPLTATGLAQAEALAQHFARSGFRFGRALSSDLKRTRATAEAILAAQFEPPRLELADFLAEIDHGPDENLPDADVTSRIGNDGITQWEELMLPPPGWNVRADWRLAEWRAFAEEATRQSPQDSVLLVTSNGAARFALAALGLGASGSWGWTKLRTGSYGLIELDGASRARLAGWNFRPDGGTGS